MRIHLSPIIAFALVAGLASCNGEKAAEARLTRSGLNPENFVSEVNGKQTALYTLTNANGMEVCITNFGGRVVSIMAPDRNGDFMDVALGYDSIAPYVDTENTPSDFGAAVGRYANRIAHGIAPMGDDTLHLPLNNCENPMYESDPSQSKFLHHLHGGPTGWQYQVYDVVESNDSSLTLQIVSPDGDNNFPGTVTAQVKYTLTSDNTLDVLFTANTDKRTIINMTNHTYFNLNGDHSRSIEDCVLQVNASNFTPIDSTFIPTGEIAPVAETPFDFTSPKAIGADINNADDVQLRYAGGYDHNFVLDTNGDDSSVAARLYSPSTGIFVEVFTNEPGLQIYTGNFLDGRQGKQQQANVRRSGVCMETQHFPDTPNNPEWPSVVLEPDQTYRSHVAYKFGVEK